MSFSAISGTITVNDASEVRSCDREVIFVIIRYKPTSEKTYLTEKLPSAAVILVNLTVLS